MDIWWSSIIYIEFQSQIKNRKCISINVPAYIENNENDFSIMDYRITIKYNGSRISQIKWIFFVFLLHSVVMIKLIISDFNGFSK